MDKLKRYLGLAAAIALLVIALLPFGNYQYYRRATALTPLDYTVLTRMTVAANFDANRIHNMQFWVTATHNLSRQFHKYGNVNI